MSTATGSFKLAPLKRTVLTFETPFGTKSSPETSTVWKRTEEKKPEKHKTVTFDVQDKNSAIVDEEPTEEELLKQGIHLARRLSSDAPHRDFNWDEDEDDGAWAMNSSFLPVSNSSKEDEEKEKEEKPTSPKVTSPPWKITQPHNVTPIDKQLKELTEQRQYNQSAELWHRDGHMDSRYKFSDHERRYRSDEIPRQELFNENSGQIEAVRRPMRVFHKFSEEERVPRVEKPKGKSIVEEQEEVMRLARENARKRKEEEQKRENEMKEAAKRKADELVAKLAAKHKEEGKEEPKKSFHEANPAFHAVSSVIDEKVKEADSQKLWSDNNLWNAPPRSTSSEGLWGPISGIYKNHTEKETTVFSSWPLSNTHDRQFTPVKSENWKAHETSPGQSERSVSDSPTVMRTSRFFPTPAGDFKENNTAETYPRTIVTSSATQDGQYLADLVSESLNVPRVILPPATRETQPFKSPSLNAIQALQTTIAEKLGKKVGSTKSSSVGPLPIPASPIVASNIPPESSTSPPALVPKEEARKKATLADAAASALEPKATQNMESQATSYNLEEAVTLLLQENLKPTIRLASGDWRIAEEAISAEWDAGLIKPESTFSESSFYYETPTSPAFLREFKPRTDIFVAILIPGGTKITTKFRQMSSLGKRTYGGPGKSKKPIRRNSEGNA